MLTSTRKRVVGVQREAASLRGAVAVSALARGQERPPIRCSCKVSAAPRLSTRNSPGCFPALLFIPLQALRDAVASDAAAIAAVVSRFAAASGAQRAAKDDVEAQLGEARRCEEEARGRHASEVEALRVELATANAALESTRADLMSERSAAAAVAASLQERVDALTAALEAALERAQSDGESTAARVAVLTAEIAAVRERAVSEAAVADARVTEAEQRAARASATAAQATKDVLARTAAMTAILTRLEGDGGHWTSGALEAAQADARMQCAISGATDDGMDHGAAVTGHPAVAPVASPAYDISWTRRKHEALARQGRGNGATGRPRTAAAALTPLGWAPAAATMTPPAAATQRGSRSAMLTPASSATRAGNHGARSPSIATPVAALRFDSETPDAPPFGGLAAEATIHGSLRRVHSAASLSAHIGAKRARLEHVLAQSAVATAGSGDREGEGQRRSYVCDGFEGDDNGAMLQHSAATASGSSGAYSAGSAAALAARMLSTAAGARSSLTASDISFV